MFFSYVGGQQRIGDNKKCRWIAGDFDCHVDVAVRCGAHRLMEHIPGFPRSHWMPPLGECLCRIAPVATMVSEFVENTLNTNKTQLLTSNYGTFRTLVISENFIPQNWPSTQLIDVTSFVQMWNTTIGAEELANICSYQTLSADNNSKSY